MSIVVTVLHLAVCVFLMLTVLLQAGKGGGMGATFGGGSSSGTVFGGSGAGNFLSRMTVAAAVIFMLTSMTLAYLSSATGVDSLKVYSSDQKKQAKEKSKTHDDILKNFGAGVDGATESSSTDLTEGTALTEGATEATEVQDEAADSAAVEKAIEEKAAAPIKDADKTLNNVKEKAEAKAPALLKNKTPKKVLKKKAAELSDKTNVKDSVAKDIKATTEDVKKSVVDKVSETKEAVLPKEAPAAPAVPKAETPKLELPKTEAPKAPADAPSPNNNQE